MVKLPKAEVHYEEVAKGMEQCRDCKHFEVLAAHHCERVQGIILPGAWCDRFLRVSRIAKAFRKPVGK